MSKCSSNIWSHGRATEKYIKEPQIASLAGQNEANLVEHTWLNFAVKRDPQTCPHKIGMDICSLVGFVCDTSHTVIKIPASSQTQICSG